MSISSPFCLLIVLFALLLTSCEAIKPISHASPAVERGSRSAFLENSAISSQPTASKSATEETIPEVQDNYSPRFYFNQPFNIEASQANQFRYAIRMDVEVEQLQNKVLYGYISDWWGTPYKMGGESRRGIDCSAFVQGLMHTVYDLPLPRVAREQKDICTPLLLSQVQEGDLIFFNTRGGISHVGVYLHNHHFVHASTSGGIMISSLEEQYWKSRFVGAGRPNAKSTAASASGQ